MHVNNSNNQISHYIDFKIGDLYIYQKLNQFEANHLGRQLKNSVTYLCVNGLLNDLSFIKPFASTDVLKATPKAPNCGKF